ncbi:MAG: winged helix DNA-binding domain-containing protein, partial [Candidatus Marinimicrobia bacterium]|nr:winged helix DNA-binding domain-containing protein [Candidatus Neomarinimicrobiota bacterium]
MIKKSQSLSINEARKLVLLSQRVLPKNKMGKAIDTTLSTIENLGYIQIDTISAIQRSHHHTLWNRNPRYDPSHIEQLVSEKKVFEYWSHAAAYLPMRDYRYTLPRKSNIASGKEKHWYQRDEKLMKKIINRIDREGPLMAKDFETDGRESDNWESKPAKQALGNLFMQGDIMIASRRNFHKVYDLTENVLPVDVDRSLPTEEEYARFLIGSYLRANGIGQASEMTYLLNNIKPKVSATLSEMVLSGELLQIEVKKSIY